MAHFHLCWELGAGLGHAGRLKALARVLQARGHRVTLGLRELVHTRSLLHDLPAPVFQAPIWQHRTEGLPPQQASLAEILLGCGYLFPESLEGLALGWRTLFGTLAPDVVVADYAPTALLAARSLGLRTASVGIGFYLPPPGRPLPALLEVPAARLAAAEQRLLASANAVLAGLGGKRVEHAADLMQGDLPLLCTWPELDHYGRSPGPAAWFGPSVSGGGIPPAWPAHPGPRVFAYLRGAHAEAAALLRALAEEGCAVLCYMPEVTANRPPPFAHPALAYASAPVDLHAAFSASRFVVAYGNHATVAQALAYGKPVLALPLQLEQLVLARRIETQSLGINAHGLPRPLDWRAAVQRMRDETALHAAAQAFAARHAGFDFSAPAPRLADALERLLSGPGPG
jgi:hypothetical protein